MKLEFYIIELGMATEWVGIIIVKEVFEGVVDDVVLRNNEVYSLIDPKD